MKIGIHHRKGSFSDQWIEYCESNEISYKLVNCYDSDIIYQLKDCDCLLWHHNHTSFKDHLVAKNILFSIQQSGKKVFPDINTTWHFDNKIAQKYLLEAIDAPLVPSFVLYDKELSLKWAKETSFPKVAKLKGGSGARNVRLILNERQAINYINKSFGRGFSQYDKLGGLRDRLDKYKRGKIGFVAVLTGFFRLFVPSKFSRESPRERGYVYFQDFMPGNDFDIRLIIIKDKAYGMKRMVRENDFRASGSKDFVYDKIDESILKIGFEVSKKLGLQSAAFDFIYGKKGEPLIVEVSFGFGTEGSGKCPGFWDASLTWHEEKFVPQFWMIENVINDTHVSGL